MTKPEELRDLIIKSHPEWKKFTVRHLKEVSGYSHDSSYKALKLLKANKKSNKKHTKTKKPSSAGSDSLHSSDNISSDPVELLIDKTLISMNDVEQSRHLYKQIICRTDLDMRLRLEAGKALASLKKEQGQINTETISEKEVMDKFRKQSTQILANKLKESSQKEL